MANILITGCSGFIGSHLVDYCLNNGDSVIGIDKVSPDKNLPHLSCTKDGSFTFHQHDIDEKILIKLEDGIDIVFHLAALASVAKSFETPNDYIQTNVRGTQNVLEYAIHAKAKKFVFISSSSIYEMLSPYAWSKRAGEDLCTMLCAHYKMPLVTLRYYNVFGPRQNLRWGYPAVVPNFIKALLSNDSPMICGTGNQSRDFTYVMDVARISRLLAEAPGTSEIFDIGFQNQISINDLLKSIKDISGSDIEPLFTEARMGDAMRSPPCNSRIRKRFAKTLLDQALKETIDWYRSND